MSDELDPFNDFVNSLEPIPSRAERAEPELTELETLIHENDKIKADYHQESDIPVNNQYWKNKQRIFSLRNFELNKPKAYKEVK